MPRGLRLVESTTSDSGVTINACQRVGPQYGSMMLER